jgi:hypothetical protein
MTENEIGTIIVDTVIIVHRELGPGLLESVYMVVLEYVAATRAIGKLIVIANVDYIEQKLRDNKKAILYQWIQYLKTQRHVYLSSTSELKY